MITKLILLSFTAVALSYGQYGYTVETATVPQFTMQYRQSNDTLLQYQKRATALMAYSLAKGKGPIFGNGSESQGKTLSVGAGQHYDAVGNVKFREVLFLAYKNVVVGTPTTILAKVYSVKADTSPDQELAGGEISMSSIVTSATAYNSVKFSSSQSTANKPFLATLEWDENIDDTIGILSNNAATRDGKGERRARLRVNPIFTNGGWKAASKQIDSTFDVDVMIIPVVEKQTGLLADAPSGVRDFTGYITSNGSAITVKYSLRKPREISVKIFSLNGKTLLVTQKQLMGAGDHLVRVGLHEKASGSYYYTINAGTSSITGKVSSVK